MRELDSDSYLAAIAGIRGRPSHRPHPGVQANARLTGTTGILLVVMLFAEGVTIPFIGPFISGP